MKYKRLGKTNLKVSRLGFGAIQICKVPETEAINLVREAVNSGINLIDTAHDYSNSEDILGKALKGLRDKVIIVTKSSKRSKENFLDDLNSSLKRLNTNYIDIYLFHFIQKDETLDKLINNGVVEALLKEKEKGKVRFIGFSCHSPDIIDRLYEIVDFSALMMPVNFISTEYVDKSYEKLVINDIGIMGMKPFGGGRIENVRVSLKYINQYKKVIPIIGMQSMKELEQNLRLINNEEHLDDKDFQTIENIRNELGDKFCRLCGYCLPCKQGIDIPDVNFLKVSFKQSSHDEVVTTERTKKVIQVEECIECGECEERCPYNLGIINMIKENRDYYLMKKEKGD